MDSGLPNSLKKMYMLALNAGPFKLNLKFKESDYAVYEF